jgi:hypothetical protein
MEIQLHAPAALLPGIEFTVSIGYTPNLGPRAATDIVEKRRVCDRAGYGIPFTQSYEP